MGWEEAMEDKGISALASSETRKKDSCATWPVSTRGRTVSLVPSYTCAQQSGHSVNGRLGQFQYGCLAKARAY